MSAIIFTLDKGCLTRVGPFSRVYYFWPNSQLALMCVTKLSRCGCYKLSQSTNTKDKLWHFGTWSNQSVPGAYLPGWGVNHDHEDGSPRVRPFHCTQVRLTPVITPNVGNSTASFLLVGDCVRAIPSIITISNWALNWCTWDKHSVHFFVHHWPEIFLDMFVKRGQWQIWMSICVYSQWSTPTFARLENESAKSPLV